MIRFLVLEFILRVELVYTVTRCCNVQLLVHACFCILQKNNISSRSGRSITKEKETKKINTMLAHPLLSIQEFLPSIDRNLLESDSMIASPATRNSALLQSRTPFAHISYLWRTWICACILNQVNCNHACVKGNIVLPLKIRRYRQRLLEILPPYQPICILNSLPLGMNYG